MNSEEAALHIIKSLKNAGYVAYFAGGWVRDYLLGQPNDDYDIATSARPEEVSRLFSKTVEVGAAFGVVVVILGEHQFEVATFRSDSCYIDGRRPKEVTFSTPKEDALRRDFTINGMFYDPLETELYDFVGGKKDLTEGVIRAIGEPAERFKEDRLRMVRAVRFSVRFGYPLEDSTEKAIKEHAGELFPAVSMERIWQEIKKIVDNRKFPQAIRMLYSVGLLTVIFPSLKKISAIDFIESIEALYALDEETPAILFVMELFPGYSQKEGEELCRYLKVSNSDKKLVLQLLKAQKLLESSPQPIEWVRFLALPFAELCLRVLSVRMDDEEREQFLSKVKTMKESYKVPIRRVIERTPLVTSRHLEERGIAPGREMGRLLREAESLSVNEGIDDLEILLERIL